MSDLGGQDGSFELDDLDRITVGTVGEPGRRTFFLQVAQGGLQISLKLEKQHVAALSGALAQLLSDLPTAGPLPTDPGLSQPVVANWAVRSMELAYASDRDRVSLVLREINEEDLETEGSGAVGRVLITREQAATLAARSAQLVEAGRPPCPFCGYPLDPAGHSCPKTNGHRPPTL